MYVRERDCWIESHAATRARKANGEEAGAHRRRRISTGFKLLGKNEIGEMSWSSPAPVRDALILRGAAHLFCIKP